MDIDKAIEELRRNPSAEGIDRLSEALKSDARPYLGRVASLLDIPDLYESALSILLKALNNEKDVAAVLDEIEKQNPNSDKVKEFIATARQANTSIMEQAYRGMIRGLTQSYLTDGTVARCPKCKSDKVVPGEGWFEFTKMACQACGYDQLADDYELEDWYPEA